LRIIQKDKGKALKVGQTKGFTDIIITQQMDTKTAQSNVESAKARNHSMSRRLTTRHSGRTFHFGLMPSNQWSKSKSHHSCTAIQFTKQKEEQHISYNKSLPY